MIKFIRDNLGIVFEYTPINGIDWIEKCFEDDRNVTIANTFFFNKNDLVEVNEDNSFDDSVCFRFAALEGAYHRIDGSIINSDYDLYIHEDISLERKFFVAQRNISIFKRVFQLVKKDIYIGGVEGDFQLNVLNDLIKKFPNTYELDKYAMARIDRILSEYLEYEDNARNSYDTYMNKKSSSNTHNYGERFIQNNELEKFEFILKKLKDMLHDEISYTEKVWQKEILKVVLLLYPKYINVFEEVAFKDVYSQKTRRLDYLLVDSCGFIDIIEIKKPNDVSILSKTQYRDNYVPLRELSGTIMQIEKYIFYLNKWGIKGEQDLTERFKEQLPGNTKINIVNPGGIIIMGRSCNLSKEEIADFEIIKRKYKNVVEIFTYDDLISRLENMVFKWKFAI